MASGDKKASGVGKFPKTQHFNNFGDHFGGYFEIVFEFRTKTNNVQVLSQID